MANFTPRIALLLASFTVVHSQLQQLAEVGVTLTTPHFMSMFERSMLRGSAVTDSFELLVHYASVLAPDFLAFLIAAAFMRTVGSVLEVFKAENRLSKKCPEMKNLEDAVDAFGCSRLHLAAHNGCLEELQVLLQQGADPNALDSWAETPLHMAARAGCADICAELLDAGADRQLQNKDKKTALMVAALAGHHEVCEALFLNENNDDASEEVDALDMFGCSDLHRAAHDGSAADVEELLLEGLDPNALDSWEETPLHMAAREGSTECCALLLASGSDPELQNKDKKTAFMVAALAGHARVSQLLFKASRVATPVPDVDTKDDFGCTSLHLAAHVASAADLEELLLDGANPNAREAWRETPLHFAARAGSVEACALLLGAGCDMRVKNKAGKTASEVADFAGHRAICMLLAKFDVHDTVPEDSDGEL